MVCVALSTERPPKPGPSNSTRRGDAVATTTGGADQGGADDLAHRCDPIVYRANAAVFTRLQLYAASPLEPDIGTRFARTVVNDYRRSAVVETGRHKVGRGAVQCQALPGEIPAME